MDLDDDRDDINGLRLKSYKVPKKNQSNICSVVNVSLDSAEYKENIYQKIKSCFKNPNSANYFKVTKAFSISNTEAENNFAKRKQIFRKEYSYQAAAESYGFLYLRNTTELQKTVKEGKLKIGNLKDSYIGKPDMDIYYHGEGKNFNRNGVLMIIKYLRGRVCYVLEDPNPLEPQPNFDCHISKISTYESFPSMGRAFKSTQVFLYEYSEDLDVLEEPSQILAWAAVEFQWIGSPLYKLISVPLTTESNTNKEQRSTDKRSKSSHRSTGAPSLRVRQNFSDCTPVFCTNLQLRMDPNAPIADGPTDPTSIALDIPVTLVTYNTNWVIYGPLVCAKWILCDLIESRVLEQCLLNYHLDLASLATAAVANGTANPGTVQNAGAGALSEVFNTHVTLSRNLENCVPATSDLQVRLPNKFLPPEAYYVNYLRMVVNDPSKDRAKMARLIEYFLETKTAGRIHLEDSPDTTLYVFPDSQISMNFGLPSVRTLDVNYLHVLLFKSRSIECDVANIDSAMEMEQTVLVKSISVEQQVEPDDGLIMAHVLVQSARNQADVQRLKLRQMCGHSIDQTLRFAKIDFQQAQVNGSQTPQTPTVVTSSPSVRLEPSAVLPEVAPVAPVITTASVTTEDHDRPYDPTENPLGLSDDPAANILSVSSNRYKRTHASPAATALGTEEATGSTPPTAPPPRKKCKKEEKDKINNKLLEIFAKIESSAKQETDFSATTPLAEEQQQQYQRYGMEHSGFPSDTLDRAKYQHQFRKGVSLYIPGGSNSISQDQPSYRSPEVSQQYRPFEGSQQYRPVDEADNPLYRSMEVSQQYRSMEGSQQYRPLEGSQQYRSMEGSQQYRSMEGSQHQRSLEGSQPYRVIDAMMGQYRVPDGGLNQYRSLDGVYRSMDRDMDQRRVLHPQPGFVDRDLRYQDLPLSGSRHYPQDIPPKQFRQLPTAYNYNSNNSNSHKNNRYNGYHR